jgi:endonuclease III
MRTLLGVYPDSVFPVDAHYGDVRQRIEWANARHSEFVELPVDWSMPPSGEYRDSLIGLAHIRFVKALPDPSDPVQPLH